MSIGNQPYSFGVWRLSFDGMVGSLWTFFYMSQTPKLETSNIFKMIDALSIEELLLVYDHVSKQKNKLTNPNALGQALMEDHNLYCPTCKKTTLVWKNGLDKKLKQKFICSICGQTIRATQNTVFHGTKGNLASWNVFIKAFIEHKSCCQSAIDVNINPKTAFLWRHKLMKTLSDINKDVVLSGTIWIDEYQDRRNSKGPKYELDRPIRRHGNDEVHSVVEDTTIILLAIDDSDHIFACFAGYGKVLKQERAYELLKDKIKKESTIITDCTNSYNKLAEELSLNHVSYKSNDISEATLLEKSTMDNLCSNLTDFLYGFHGVKDKYLQDYLNYFVLLRHLKYTTEDEKEKMIDIFSRAANQGYKLKLRDLYTG